MRTRVRWACLLLWALPCAACSSGGSGGERVFIVPGETGATGGSSAGGAPGGAAGSVSGGAGSVAGAAGTDPAQPPPADPTCDTCGEATCVDLESDARHCGECARACPSSATCEQGSCRCPGAQLLCEGRYSEVCDCGGEICAGACVDTRADANHCGGCGVACGAGRSCAAGACACAASVSFAADVLPIFAVRCAQSGCHAARAPKQGLSLTASAAHAELVNASAEQCADGRVRVAPGDAASSYLMDKLLGVDLCSGTRMPKGGSLSAAEIEAVGAWICNGALAD